MKGKNIFIFVALAGVFFACNQSENKSSDSATQPTIAGQAISLTTIQWIDTALDKGTVNEGEKVEVVYRFKNTGDKPLVIKDVRPSCGCTVAEKPQQPIASGQEGSIKAVFDSHNKPGPNHKTLHVQANTKEETYQLTFDVNVNKKS